MDYSATSYKYRPLYSTFTSSQVARIFFLASSCALYSH
jgi:hypothetical protein